MLHNPIRVKRAKSNRSRCKNCGTKIEKDAWRGEIDNDFGSHDNLCISCARDLKNRINKEFEKVEAST